mmetsp:Transcript_36125/g.100295  ORF Transcript_36125/g.100295 Transcript_36125/m.100295 type:complete len:327 (-) Transcript_36125:106-1086(-)|eukprot:CAMPEP_0179119088 /NCGR_PEP_ID=MMETSP0796-20121207/56045_1 /TAXON_ID=73915 /ORGANISM="Pyrodinium bahamense, Strain pbaha01" /LENGTH=326 /DNA_ID=CAMNT_0020817579 /DNA_START=75 /DNA_END=1055 /DNA_ORIENTATION=-
MWREFLTSGTFWGSVVSSYTTNLAFGITANLLLTKGKAMIPVLDGFHGDLAMAFASSAFFCGLLTPLFSSCFIHRKVQRGAVRPPDAAAVARSWWGWLLQRRTVARSFLLAFWDVAVFGAPAVLFGGLACSGLERDACQLEVWAFLAVLVIWCVPVQVETSLLNYAAAAHRSRRPDSSPLVPEDQAGTAQDAPVDPLAEQYLAAAVKMSSEEAADFLAFFSRVNPRAEQRYTDLCRENNTLDEYMANPLVFILANNPYCCAHIARTYVDHRARSTESTPNSVTGESRTDSFTGLALPVAPSGVRAAEDAADREQKSRHGQECRRAA